MRAADYLASDRIYIFPHDHGSSRNRFYQRPVCSVASKLRAVFIRKWVGVRRLQPYSTFKDTIGVPESYHPNA